MQSLNLSKGTIEYNITNIFQFLSYLECNGHHDFNTLSLSNVAGYIIEAAKTHEGSMGNIIYFLRLFLSYLRKNSLVQKDFDPVLNKAVQ